MPSEPLVPTIDTLPAGVEHLGLPTPFPVGPVNAYLLLGDPLTIVDPGMLWADTTDLIAAGLARHGRTIAELAQVVVTHGHPDHYMGLAPVVQRFPGVKVLARAPVRTEIAMQFRAKWVHWQTIMADQIPIEPVVPELLEGDKLILEGHEIRIIDLPPAETMDATAYYVPSARVLIPGDLIFSKMHAYFADLKQTGSTDCQWKKVTSRSSQPPPLPPRSMAKSE